MSGGLAPGQDTYMYKYIPGCMYGERGLKDD